MAAGEDLASRLRAPVEAELLSQALAAGGLELVARGVSMRPLLRSGDRVRLEVRPPQRGDVALVALEDRVVLHRLVGRRGRRWQVQGDARPRADGWVPPDRILAVATGFRRGAEADDGGSWHRLDRPRDRWRGLVVASVSQTLRRCLR